MANMSLAPVFRCSNCHWQAQELPLEQCPVCQVRQFEPYQPVRFAVWQFAFVVAAVSLYWVLTRTLGGIYDPFWLITAGYQEGYLEYSLFGVLACLVLLPGILCWLVVRRPISFAISTFSLLLWIGFCVLMQGMVFA